MTTPQLPIGSGARQPQIVQHPSKHQSSRNGAPIRAICLHHTAGTNSLQWLTQNPNQVSTHVLITKAGVIYRMVPDERAAHTVGRSNLGLYVAIAKLLYPKKKGSANENTLSIEIENLGNGKDEYTAAQYNAVGWQIAQWWNTYNPLPVIPHSLIDTEGKNDPYALDFARIYREALAHYDH